MSKALQVVKSKELQEIEDSLQGLDPLTGLEVTDADRIREAYSERMSHVYKSVYEDMRHLAMTGTKHRRFPKEGSSADYDVKELKDWQAMFLEKGFEVKTKFFRLFWWRQPYLIVSW